MRAQFRSELLKQRTTRTNLGLLGWMVALVLFVVLLHGLSRPVSDLSGETKQLQLFGWGTTLGALFAALLGAMSITSEIRHGTIRPTFLTTPKRTRVLAAKAGVSALAAALMGLLAEATAAGAGTASLAARGISLETTAGDWAQLLAGGAAAAALWAVIGTGVGALVRNQVVTIVGLAVWVVL